MVMQTMLVKRISQEAEQMPRGSSKAIAYFVKCYSEWKKLRSFEQKERLEFFERRHGVVFVQLLVLFDSLVGNE